MGRLPTLRPKEVIKALERGGFFIHHQTGSHVAMRHQEDKTIRVTVPLHSKDIKVGTLNSILKQAGLTTEEFKGLL
ncbi:MAG: type II toxin-antitoxin system HicA family toxin [Candidatus Brocadiales bacterium]